MKAYQVKLDIPCQDWQGWEKGTTSDCRIATTARL